MCATNTRLFGGGVKRAPGRTTLISHVGNTKTKKTKMQTKLYSYNSPENLKNCKGTGFKPWNGKPRVYVTKPRKMAAAVRSEKRAFETDLKQNKVK